MQEGCGWRARCGGSEQGVSTAGEDSDGDTRGGCSDTWRDVVSRLGRKGEGGPSNCV